jgi:hypothetical protein
MDIKRLVDLVDRGPADDHFYPATGSDTLFRATWARYQNAVPEMVEVGYLGHAAWGQRITVPIRRAETGDMLQWLCLRLKPRSWLGSELENKVVSGAWTYADPSGAWMWAASLGSVAIQKVEFEIGDTLVERWGGEWMDVWSRTWLDAGRAPVWDSDLYGQMSPMILRDTTRPGWTTVRPTSDGYVYCWLPLTFLRRPQSAFPMAAVGDLQEIRVHITLRPFTDVVRRRARVRSSASETPLGEIVGFTDNTGLSPIHRNVRLPTRVPEFEDATVFAGVTHFEDPLRSAYMRQPLELLYEPVTHMVFDVSDKLARARGEDETVGMQLRLTELNGPIREICWFLRRKTVWQYNEWTNYGALGEDELVATADRNEFAVQVPVPTPMLRRARLLVENAVWRDEEEQWWRQEYGLAHRGGIRAARGMIYGIILGDGREWMAEDLQPAGTINASKAEIRLDLEIAPPPPAPSPCGPEAAPEVGWEVHVFATGLNWMRFVRGLVGPLFKD